MSKNPADFTPNVVDPGSGPKPRVDSIDQLGATIYAGGIFSQVSDSTQTLTYDRDNLMAFDSATGAMQSFAPVFDGPVAAVLAVPGAVYVGGTFSTVNGTSSPALVKLDPDTGAVDPTFDPGYTRGAVNDLLMTGNRLIVAGSVGKKLTALDPLTGANTGYLDLGISDALPTARGGVAVFRIAVNPAGDRLIATGNFQTVLGQSRTKFFMIDLGPTDATLDPWYYPPLATPCATNSPRRVANLQGVDWSPDGSYFVITATGQIPRPGDRNITVCDAAARFNLDDATTPVWINYTGGDSVWTTAVTGSAVYVQGHFSWLDNPNGWASKCPTGDPCAPRKGVGAIDPASGLALPWNPRKPAQLGGKDFLVTPDGLWIGSDSQDIQREHRAGIAFMPLPS